MLFYIYLIEKQSFWHPKLAKVKSEDSFEKFNFIKNVFPIYSPKQNVSMYDGRDACSGDL